MNVKVKVELCASPEERDREDMYSAAESLTNEMDSIYIYQSSNQKNELIAEFTFDKAPQHSVVDRIGKEFSDNVENYDESTIYFPKKLTKKLVKKSKAKYTVTQGQYLSFIYYFIKLNGVAPAEVDFQKYFKKSPPAVHSMILKLEEKGFIERKPKISRSIKLLLVRSDLPDLQ